MIALLRRNFWRLALAILLSVGIVWWLIADSTVEAGSAKAIPDAGSPGTVFGPIISESPVFAAQSITAALPKQSRTAELNAPTEEELRLWPHLGEKASTPEERTRVKAQWQQFAQLYPENMYVPLSLQPTPTPEQLQVMRRRRDNVDEIEAYQAAQKSSVRNLPPGQTPLSPETLPSADPLAYQDFLHVKIHELESKVQLANFALASNQLNSDQRAIITKELQKWNLDLEEFRRLKTSMPLR